MPAPALGRKTALRALRNFGLWFAAIGSVACGPSVHEDETDWSWFEGIDAPIVNRRMRHRESNANNSDDVATGDVPSA